MRRHIKCLTDEERESERLRIEALCHCCCKQEATIKTGEPDIEQICQDCANRTARDLADDELFDVLRELARGLNVTYVATDTGKITEVKPSRRPEPNRKPN